MNNLPAPAVASLSMVAVYLLRLALPKMPRWLLPLASVAIAVLAGVAGDIPHISWAEVGDGAMAGLAGAGAWSVVGKHIAARVRPVD